MSRANYMAKWPDDFDPDNSDILAEGAFISEWIGENYPDWEIPLHVHPTGQLIHTLSGTSFLVIKGQSVPVCNGCAMWVPAGIPHCVRILDGSSLLCFHPGVRFLDQLPQEPQSLILNSLALELIRYFCLRREKAPRTEAHWQKIVECAVTELSLSPILPSLFVKPTRNKKLTTIIEMINDDQRCSWKNKDWAEFFNMSEKSLGRLCMQETGLTLKKFRTHYLMLRSLQLLSEDTAEGVAVRIGYESLSSFIAAFKEYFGLTPGAFKKHFE